MLEEQRFWNSEATFRLIHDVVNSSVSDHIALPSKGGAMENWGLITYGEPVLCINPETSAATGKLTVASIIAHELAHQVSRKSASNCSLVTYGDEMISKQNSRRANAYNLKIISDLYDWKNRTFCQRVDFLSVTEFSFYSLFLDINYINLLT